MECNYPEKILQPKTKTGFFVLITSPLKVCKTCVGVLQLFLQMPDLLM